MKKLLVIFLIALASCTAVKENSDDNVMLENSGYSLLNPNPFSPIMPINPKRIKHSLNAYTPKILDSIKHPLKKTNVLKTNIPKINVPKTNVPKKNVSKMDPRKNLNEVKKLPIKGVNGLFNGKIGKIFRKLSDMVKKGIAWLKKNNLWNPIIEQLKSLGQKYGKELCEKALPPEVCGPAIDFALDHLLKADKQN